MPTLSIRLPANLETFVETMVKNGIAPNKAEVVRQALISYAEKQAIASVLQAEQEIRDGDVLSGDIKKLF
ncbi:hypothetical protein KJ673_03785 [Patescibacteria group bacterium]|nr:hypothetical protein [Patescibacteria group bacterium]MBU4452741.1 hypothetical protein [Patescibacteria group bacterium]MCG2687740.1 hypothetical protein [Candidatus Parcubacteria bacterium]